MNPLIQLKKATPLFFVAFGLAYSGLSPRAQAVSPAPDGGYPGANTAEGQNALFSLTTGTYNTAVGLFSLRSNTTGSYNTATGAGALLANTAAENTANGFGALFSNTIGIDNTATGALALFSNTTGPDNTANGLHALLSNTGGSANTATGAFALLSNTTGDDNTANGSFALLSNTTGEANTANGENALVSNTTGFNNTALGVGAGNNVTTAGNVICIGAGVAGANTSGTCFIGSIFGVTTSNGVGVFVNSNGQLGTATSSQRYKNEIKPMDQASEALFALKPVTFRYRKEIDPTGKSQFGLVAEDVEKVNPDLIVRDKEGKPYTVRYDQVNAMLLNEFLKEHRRFEEQQGKIEKQGAIIAQQQKQIEALTAGLQKVSAQLEASKPAPQVVNNNQ